MKHHPRFSDWLIVNQRTIDCHTVGLEESVDSLSIVRFYPKLAVFHEKSKWHSHIDYTWRESRCTADLVQLGWISVVGCDDNQTVLLPLAQVVLVRLIFNESQLVDTVLFGLLSLALLVPPVEEECSKDIRCTEQTGRNDGVNDDDRQGKPKVLFVDPAIALIFTPERVRSDRCCMLLLLTQWVHIVFYD